MGVIDLYHRLRNLEKRVDSGGNGVNYSTEEHVIGTWIDGKHIYEKTIIIENNTVNGVNNIPHGIENIEQVVDYNFFTYSRNTGGLNVFRFAPTNENYNKSDSTVRSNFILMLMYCSREYIVVAVGNDWSAGGPFASTHFISTIRYTKTTD